MLPFLTGEGVERVDWQWFFREMRLLEQIGSIAVRPWIGLCYQRGYGTHDDPRRSLEYCNDPSHYVSSLVKKDNSQKNRQELRTIIAQASKNKEPLADYILALFDHDSKNVKQRTSAECTLLEVAERKNTLALVSLGEIWMRKGKLATAIVLWEEAIQKGNAEAMCKVGSVYYDSPNPLQRRWGRKLYWDGFYSYLPELRPNQIM